MNWSWPTHTGRVRYRTPGVWARELRVRRRDIEGVDTQTAGFLGVTERGPTTPQRVTSVGEFTRVYGGSISEGYLPEAVAGFFDNGGKRCYVARISAAQTAATATLTDDADDPVVDVAAVGPGAWGTSVAVTVSDSPSGLAEEFTLQIRYWRDAATSDPAALGSPAVEEVYEGLSVASHAPTPLEMSVNGSSTLVTVDRRPGAETRPTNGTTFLDGPTADPQPALAAYRGETETTPTGLAALAAIDEVAVVCAPGSAAVSGVAAALTTHCEDCGDRFAVLDGPKTTDVGTLYPPVDSRVAALYHPWVTVPGSDGGQTRTVPPSGHIAGVYARVDGRRGVHKSPANERLYGVVDVADDISPAEQAVLNPRGVNCIRSFPDRGIRVWGARTTATASDPAYRYVPVARLRLFLEESIAEGLDWVVFETNDEATWTAVRTAVESFLTTRWRQGALRGTTPDEAFFVRCDRTTMTQSDVDNGRLVVQVGFAPLKPAEFLVFEITRTTAAA